MPTAATVVAAPWSSLGYRSGLLSHLLFPLGPPHCLPQSDLPDADLVMSLTAHSPWLPITRRIRLNF